MSSDYKHLTSALYKKVGTSHESVGRACEDFVARATSRDGSITAIALSDGAGSCKNSALGAKVVSETAVALLCEQFNSLYRIKADSASSMILSAVRMSLARAALENGITDFSSLSATLIVAALSVDGRYLVYHIGDGIAVGYTPETGGTVLSSYRHDGPSSITSFVTERSPTFNLRRGVGVTSILLTSDGAENYLVCSDRVAFYLRFIQELSHDLDEESLTSLFDELCTLLKIKGMTDDCSFALVTDKSALDRVKRHAMPEALELLVGNLDINRPLKSLNETFKSPRRQGSHQSKTVSDTSGTPKMSPTPTSHDTLNISDTPDTPNNSNTPDTKS